MHMSSAERDVLGVSSYGISVTTMEEVFMKVREGADETLRHRSSPTACVPLCINVHVHVHNIIHV